MATQALSKKIQKSTVSRADSVQKKTLNRKVNRKETNAAPAYLQAKLNVSAPQDPQEREADQVADNVMRMPAQRSSDNTSRKINRASLKPGITPMNRAQKDKASRDSLKPGEEKIHRASLKPGEDSIQRKSDSEAPEATDKVENKINAKRGQGERLPDNVRSDMENRFGRDFSAVRIHLDSEAAEMSAEIDAKAFTVGNDIFFGNGRFDANSDEGRRLLAHELTHVAQQQQAPVTNEKNEEVSRSDEKTQRWSLTGWLADKAWSVLKRVAPSGLYKLVREVYKKGIFGYLKEIIGNAVSSIFDGLKRGANVLTNFFASFGRMAKTAKEIIKALISGNCKPLFAAVKTLKDTLSEAAGDAWQAIKDFFQPVGDFFSDLWSSWGAPVLDWLKKTAGSVWTWLKDLGKTIWNWTKPVRDYAGRAWTWLKGKLGMGGDNSQGDSEGGIMGWIKEKAASAWATVKEVMDPVIKPVKKFVGKVMDVLPIKAILNLRETVQGWLKSAGDMGAAMGDDGSGVADQQVSLREQILPAVISTMQSVRDSLSSTGLWLGEKIGGVVADFTGFMSKLRANVILKYVAPILSWVETGITSLGSWAKDTVQSLFNWLGDGLVKLAKFIEPVLNALQKVADTILNLLAKIPDLILGPIWRAIPKCIRDPLKDFVLNQILARVPFFKQLLSVKDAWEKIKETGLMILKQVFVDGNLLGALWTLFKAILNIFSLPVKLISNILIKGAQSLGAIIAAPLDFLINIIRAMGLGFTNFFGNILTHLLKGAMDWLFGAVAKAGLTIPEDFSPKSIFSFVLDILGLTMDLVWKKLVEKIGQDKVDKFKEKLQQASGALEWVKVAVTEGPASLWEKLKEKLSEIWNMVLDGVIGWINDKVIAWAQRWLLALLDVTGIMPVINAAIAIYRAIESFMEQLKAMLEIINTVLNGVADLAAGAIESAAGFLESALAKAIPVIISFLANQAGLGNIAEKISEILSAIRIKVEEAVGWLVGTVVDAISAFVGMVKGGAKAVVNVAKAGVGKVIKWWKARTNFKTKDGGEHHLFYKGSKSSAKLMVASDTPYTIESIAKNKAWNGVEISSQDVGIITNQLKQANSAQNKLDTNSSDAKAMGDLNKALQDISVVLKKYTLSKANIYYPSGVTNDPVLINWYKTVSDYTDVTIKGKKYKFNGGPNQVSICGKGFGVDFSNLKKANEIFTKGSSTDRAESTNLKRCLKKEGAKVKNLDSGKDDISIGIEEDPDNYQIDHVRDLALGGPDKENNVWPLRSRKNALANKTQNQWVSYYDESVSKFVPTKVSELKSGTSITVIKMESLSGEVTSEANPVANSNPDGPVPIVWYKSPDDYAKIKLSKMVNGKRKIDEYRVGERLDLTGVDRKLKPLKTDGDYLNPLNKVWKINKSDNRNISNLVSTNLRNYYKNYLASKNNAVDNGRRRVQVSEGVATELTPRDLSKETQIDHVFDISMGGEDKRENLWPMRGDRNNYAAKNGMQYVAYTHNMKKIISQASKIPLGMQVKVVKIGGASSQTKPSGYTQLKKLVKEKANA